MDFICIAWISGFGGGPFGFAPIFKDGSSGGSMENRLDQIDCSGSSRPFVCPGLYGMYGISTMGGTGEGS